MKVANPELPTNSSTRLVPFQRFLDPFVVVGVLWGLASMYGVDMVRDYLWLSTAAVLLSFSVFPASGRYRLESEQTPSWEIPRIITGWGLILMALLAIGFITKSSGTFSRLLLVSWAACTPMALLAFHGILQFIASRYLSSRTRKVVIVGIGELGRYLAEQIRDTPHLGLEFCGYFDDKFPRIPSGGTMGKVLLGRLETIADYVAEQRIDMVLISAPISDTNLDRVIQDLQDTTARVYFVPNTLMFKKMFQNTLMLNVMQARTHDLNGIPLISIWENPLYEVQSDLKRLLDIAVAGTALLLLSPIMIAIAFLVKLSSPGPVIFKQRRYGLNGQEILVYKFRSMRVTENGPHVKQATRDDPRVTKVGAFLRRTSLDELPQFINVLQGRMSVVGPRPHAVAHNETYRKLIRGYMLRHKAKPGITGWAQIHGHRGETDTLDKMEQRVEYDLQYFRNWSLALDLEIIFKTAFVFFNSRNAY
jgi:putative colanic acid biosysnthesis UDP-glucose lipid carrier transferase